MRAILDLLFSDLLLQVGNRGESVVGDDLVQISKEMIIEYLNYEVSEHALLDSVFAPLHQHAHSTGYITKRDILAANIECVNSLNDEMIAKFPREKSSLLQF